MAPTNPARRMQETYGGCQKFLLLFGRIGPLALRPCALLRAWGFCHIQWISSKFHGDMVIYGDMVCLALALAPSCAALHFWCLYIMLSKSYLPLRCDWKDGVFYKSPYVFVYTCWVLQKGGTISRMTQKSCFKNSGEVPCPGLAKKTCWMYVFLKTMDAAIQGIISFLNSIVLVPLANIVWTKNTVNHAKETS